jgi:hypothetical protein
MQYLLNMRTFNRVAAIILSVLFVSISGCTYVSDPIEGCWYTSLMGMEMYIAFNSGGSAYISSSFGTGAMAWEKVGTNHYILYPSNDRSKKYDIYYDGQTQSIVLDTNQKMMFTNQNMQIQFIKTKCKE